MSNTLQLLEFDRLRSLLAEHTTFPPARELAIALEPAYQAEEVSRLRQETEEAYRILSLAGKLDFSAADIRPSLKRASWDAVLLSQELREVSQTLKTARLARHTFWRWRREASNLALLAENIPELTDLEKEIEQCIGAGGEVVDKASVELKRLRGEVREAHQELADALNRIIRSPLGREVLQEPIITIRSDRMVLPLKAEMKGRLRGLVHDVSASSATVFVEPFSTVKPGNRWRELVLEEQQEVQRILRGLSLLVGKQSAAALRGVETLAILDLILAKARLAFSRQWTLPQIWEGERPYIRLVKARHPLLQGEVVPISLEISPEHPVLLISGPHAGGKTVTLKTVGLLTLLFQSGLPLPAEQESVLSVFDGVYVDIGDQQSVEESRSTFSSHVQNYSTILEKATPSSLVLLDELGTSTDPEEGSALAKAILSHLAERRVTVIATGHYRNVADLVQSHPLMLNASVELHPLTLAPTYQLTVGLPGRSYALLMASRYGLPREIVEAARKEMAPRQVQEEDLLSELQQERYAAVRKRQEAEQLQAQAAAQRQELEQQLADIASRKAEMLEEAKRELQQRVEEVRERLREAEKKLQAAGEVKEIREAMSGVLASRRELRGEKWRLSAAEEPRWRQDLRPGDRVKVKGYRFEGTVLSRPDSRGRVELLIGNSRAFFPVEELASGERPAPSPFPSPPPVPRPTLRREEELELNLRGERVEEALARLENFLDHALLQQTRRVRIVHGQGSGALRQAIRERLAGHPLVKDFAPAALHVGGDGVTIVELK